MHFVKVIVGRAKRGQQKYFATMDFGTWSNLPQILSISALSLFAPNFVNMCST